MKIVFFVHCFFPDHFYGTETYTLELAKNYAAWGHDVTVVSAIFQGEPATENLLSHFEYEGIKVICVDKNKVPHSRIKETYYQPEMREILKSLLSELKPDVVHVTHLINHTSVLLEATSALGIPTYATFTDFFGFCLNNKLEAADGALCAGPSPSRSNCVACYIKEALAAKSVGGWVMPSRQRLQKSSQPRRRSCEKCQG
ncbi:glycosyltransferase [Pseudomonas lactucae]|uniref:glycosyltransferase n=1 Tax=Pseudomonas lactucae TaxID=2813360 RepID=UPI0019673F46|nr:glycosyltransferase [Pseudomonas lactucae]MBN2986714.1 glycosyltransferase [Pseudomonas lactucae]